MRTNKILFVQLVRSASPPIGFARYNAIGHAYGVRRTQQMVAELSHELDTPHARTLLSDKLIGLILGNVKVADEPTKALDKEPSKLRPKHLVPWRVRRWLRATVLKAPLDWNVLAFRAYIICKMHKILHEDARTFK